MFLLKPRKTMSYSHFFNFIDKDKIEVLFEVGANNGNDTLIIDNYFNPNEYQVSILSDCLWRNTNYV